MLNLVKLGAGITMVGCSLVVIVFLLVVLFAIWGVSC
jgi:Na+-transporting methylmalonyl-CoA/oxaloacetate decarboxylase gamma subunit